MKQEQQRIAIAEACGWIIEDGDNWYGLQCGDLPGDSLRPIPHYPNDLNAMHEAEQFLDYRKAMEYVRQLEQKCWHRDGELSDGVLSLVRATSDQRAEAFLRTLNLWAE